MHMSTCRPLLIHHTAGFHHVVDAHTPNLDVHSATCHSRPDSVTQSLATEGWFAWRLISSLCRVCALRSVPVWGLTRRRYGARAGFRLGDLTRGLDAATGGGGGGGQLPFSPIAPPALPLFIQTR